MQIRSMTPFEPATPILDPAVTVESLVNKFRITAKEAAEALDRTDELLFMNNLYQVHVRKIDGREAFGCDIIHLSIRRLDRESIHDWRHLQQIKNELVGPEFEAIEIYPAEDRLVDTANQYHLWVLADPKIRIPLGWDTRMVDAEPLGRARNRPFDKENKT